MNYKTDAQIHHDVIHELKWDSRVDETDVGVEVDKGIVTLTGTVPNYAKSLAAQEAAHRVVGVLDVANDIQIKTPGAGRPTDTELAQAVRDAMRWSVFVNDKRVTSTVHNGFVTLEGTVDSVHERNEAILAVRALDGVNGVANRVKVADAIVHPNDVRIAIEAALNRRAENAVHGITVGVVDHDVILDGHVPSWIEKKTVIDAASHVKGITKVVDHINVVPDEMSHLAI